MCAVNKKPYEFEVISVPYICLATQLGKAFSTLQVENMKSVEHEDTDFNNEYSVDPLADPRLDKMDLFNMVDSKDRDAIMNATPSFDVGPSDVYPSSDVSAPAENEASSASGPGE